MNFQTTRCRRLMNCRALFPRSRYLLFSSRRRRWFSISTLRKTRELLRKINRDPSKSGAGFGERFALSTLHQQRLQPRKPLARSACLPICTCITETDVFNLKHFRTDVWLSPLDFISRKMFNVHIHISAISLGSTLSSAHCFARCVVSAEKSAIDNKTARKKRE